MIEFNVKAKEQRKIKVNFPDGISKEFVLLSRTVGNQRKILEAHNRLKKLNEKDPTKSLDFLNEMLGLLFTGSTLEDFEGMDMDELVELINSVKDGIISEEPRIDPEKKTEQNKPT
ncbi:MAG TPA: hypothetical protein VMW91_08795 [Desulfosporosinus sp.]|nr:hypothetical protein [Desulfosporosinus sp.]